jgi:hypothetical protein
MSIASDAERSSSESKLTVLASPEWREWLARLASHCRLSLAGTVDQSTAHFAKAVGFTEEPPRR